MKYWIFAVVFAIMISPVRVNAAGLAVEAKSAVLIEPSTGKILFENNANERLPLASVTKVMTIYLIYEALEEGKIKLDDVVTVSEHAASMGGSQVFLEQGEHQPVRDLLKSVVIASANDASVAMAEFISGSEEAFVEMMNKKALSMGMANSHFVNACGLDADEHYSSAMDIAKLSQALVTKYPQCLELSGVWQDTIVHKTARGESEFGLTNTNKLLKWYKGATGLKTGSTGKALYCLSATAQRDGMGLIAVVLGAPTPTVRFQEVMKMFDYGFANFQVAKGDEQGTALGEVQVFKGELLSVPAVIKNQVNAVLPKGNTVQLEKAVSLKESLSAPISEGDVVGEVVYSYNNNVVGTSTLVASRSVDKASFMDMLIRTASFWFQ